MPKKDDFWSNLDAEHFNDEDYKHAKNVWEDFETKNVDEYHDIYVKVMHYC